MQHNCSYYMSGYLIQLLILMVMYIFYFTEIQRFTISKEDNVQELSFKNDTAFSVKIPSGFIETGISILYMIFRYDKNNSVPNPKYFFRVISV